MPSSGWTKPTAEHRLSDHLAYAMLGRVFTPEIVDAAVAEAARVEQRSRLLPARLVVYYVLGLALFSRSSYEEVIRLLVAGRSWSRGWSESWDLPTKAALFKARARLGYEPMQALFDRVAQPIPSQHPDMPDVPRWVLSLDRLAIDIADTAPNVEEFGRSEATSPSVELTGLTEFSSGAIIGALVGDAGDDDGISSRILSRLSADALVVADRTTYSPALWTSVVATGADALWELPPDADPPQRARVISLASRERARTAPLRLATTVPSGSDIGDAQLEELFVRRRTLASAFREFAAHANAPRVVLRSRVPDGVRQELYGFLCVHYAMRVLLTPPTDEAPAQISKLTEPEARRPSQRIRAAATRRIS